jgi:hypothetical protein
VGIFESINFLSLELPGHVYPLITGSPQGMIFSQSLERSWSLRILAALETFVNLLVGGNRKAGIFTKLQIPLDCVPTVVKILVIR